MSDQSNPSKQTGSTDPRVQAAIGEYLERVDRGEVVNRDEFLVRHIEIAAPLRSFFAAEEPLRKMAVTRTPEESAGISTRSIAAQGQETVQPKPQRGGSLGATGSGLAGQFGRYRIVRALGKGAMGAVYLAEDSQLERQVALKTPHFEDDPTGELVARFYREARAAAMLRQANICPVYDVGQIEGKHFISMAYIEGRPLSDVIHGDKPPTERQMVLVLHKLARALQEAHDHGIVHRDLKPANIMVDQKGEPIIMDFGLARKRRTDGEASLTQSGMILGSPAYMSPEQIEGDPDSVGPASDEYSLGVVLYEMLTGQLPFRGSVVNVLAQVITKGATPPSELRPGIDPRIEAVCVRMMSKRAADRFPSMKAVADQLAAIVKSPAPAPSAAEKSPTANRPRAAPDASRENASASQIRKSIKPKALTESDLTSLEELVRKCLRHRDYEQMIQIIERIPEERRNDALQTSLEKAREKVDEISFLICEIDEADRLADRQTVLKKAEELLKIKPGHHRAREVQEKYSGYGEGSAVRLGPLQQFTRPWNEGGWIPWSVLAFGLAVFAVMYGVMVIYFGKTAIVVDIKDPGVEVTVKETSLMITGPDKQSVKVEPGDHALKINFAGLETTTKSFSLKQGETKTVTVSIVNKEIVARLESEVLALTPRDQEDGHGKKLDRDSSDEPDKERDREIRARENRNRAERRIVKQDPPSISTQMTPPVDRFVLLFNGKDLSGWQAVPNQPAQWRVERGVLIGSGQTASHLYTERGDYKNFQLRARVRINQGGDSGICFRTPFGPQVSGIEAQIVYAHDGQGNTGSLYVAGSGLVAPVTQAPALTNEWFQLDLLVDNDRIVTQVNGKTAAEYADVNHRFVEGHIALQCNPQTVVEFSKIEIKELSSQTTAVPPQREDPDRRAAEWVLSIGGTIKINENREVRTADDLPKEAFELTDVHLGGNSKVSDQGLACFNECKHVKVLSLWVTNLSDAGLDHFKECRNLTHLDLNNDPKVSDAGLVYFENCKDLISLSLDGDTRVSDVGLAHFRACKNLAELKLSGTQVTDVGLAYFKGCRDLRMLSLRGAARISDAGMVHFQDCTRLTWLDLNYTKITDAGLAHFHRCVELEDLYVGWGSRGVTDASMRYIGSLRRLGRLVLGANPVTNAGLAFLEGSTRLGFLDLAETRVGGPGLQHLRNLSRLKNIQLGGLDLVDGDLAHLRSLTELEDLGLAGSRVSGPGLANLKGMNRLHVLDLSGSRVTNSGLNQLKTLVQVQKLHLRGTRVTDAGLHHLAGLTNLDELDLTDTKVTAAGGAKLQKSIPACKILANPKAP